MRVTVLGATGRTGRPLTQVLLEHGHEVTVLVRDPARLGELADGRVRQAVGSSTDPEALAGAVSGADAVVSALGPTAREGTLHQDTARALVQVMTEAGVRRFVGVSGAGIDVPGDQKSRRDKAVSFLMQRLGGAVVADKSGEYRILAASDLAWTLVRAPRLFDGEPTGRVQHHAHRSPRSTRIGRADLAAFLVEVLERDLYLRQAPLVAQAR